MLRLEWSGDIAIFGSSPSKFLANEYFELKNLFLNFSFSSVMHFADQPICRINLFSPPPPPA